MAGRTTAFVLKPSSLDKHTSKIKAATISNTPSAESNSDATKDEVKPSSLNSNSSHTSDEEDKKNEEENSETVGFRNPCTFGTKSLTSKAVKEELKTTFVFGESMEKRATSTNRNGAISPSSETSSDGKSENDSKEEKSNESSKSLIESAREAEIRKNIRYELTTEEEIVTGEEDDSNVFQLYAKLFTYNFKDTTWRDIGRVLVRLNDSFKDKDSFSSRLVIRSVACQKVLLNLKLSSKISICQTSTNSRKLKLTAPSQEKDGIIQMYLISLYKNDDIYTMLHSVTSRIEQLKIAEVRKEIESDNDSNDNKDEKCNLKRPLTDDEDDILEKCEREQMSTKQIRVETTAND